MDRLLDKLDDAVFLRKFHGWMTLTWFTLIFVSISTGLKKSLVWVVLMSAWANFVGHMSSWAASRAEVKIDKDTARLR